MRGYYVPLVAGLILIASTFLPWVTIGGTTLRGMPNLPALWVAGLGAIAAVLATLSLITRKNSRHPLLVVGLFALGIMILTWRIFPRSVGERALSLSQALAIVGEAAERAIGDDQGRQAARPGQQEHQEDLVFHRLDRIEAGEDLAGHDAGQGDDAGRRHLVDDRQKAPAHAAAQRLGHGPPVGVAQA